jgi:hypothetical protein
VASTDFAFYNVEVAFDVEFAGEAVPRPSHRNTEHLAGRSQSLPIVCLPRRTRRGEPLQLQCPEDLGYDQQPGIAMGQHQDGVVAALMARAARGPSWPLSGLSKPLRFCSPNPFSLAVDGVPEGAAVNGTHALLTLTRPAPVSSNAPRPLKLR